MTMLVLTHRLFESVTAFRAGSWVASPQFGGGGPHGEVLGRTIGIVGYGRIGREVAERAAGLKCRVLAAKAEACRRHSAADAFKAGQHGALRRTGHGAPELDLKRPEQSLKLVQRAIPQLAAGDDLRHPISPVCCEAPTIRAFPAVTGSHRPQ
jgi:D-isomer specific 2-hydroxyacid dehydrogenase, NAD binding domain